MRNPKTVDYHVDYFIDQCASDEMTLANIDDCAHILGLTEVAVLKHYSKGLPNGEKAWISWKCVVPDQFDAYLKDIASFQSNYGIRFFSGVETELVNESGEINIEPEQQKRLDMVALSFHYMPDLDILKMDLMEYPRFLGQYKEQCNTKAVNNILRWEEKVRSIGAQPIVEGLVNAYINAIRKNVKVRTLSHLGNCIWQLDDYKAPVYDMPPSKQIALLEPLMKCMAEQEVLWEIHSVEEKDYPIYKRANELGVRFCSTVDSHFIQNGWANLINHNHNIASFERYDIKMGVLKIDET